MKAVLNSRGNNNLWLNAYYKTEGFTYTTLDMSSVCRKSTEIMLRERILILRLPLFYQIIDENNAFLAKVKNFEN